MIFIYETVWDMAQPGTSEIEPSEAECIRNLEVEQTEGKPSLEFADTEHEDDILQQQVLPLTQEDPMNTAGDTTQALQSEKRKKKQSEKVHSKKVKSERNVGNGPKMSREKQGQVKGMLEFADSEHEEEILGQQVSSLTQEDPVNTAGDTTHALQSGKRKMKQCEKVQSKKVKSERNVADGKKMSREKQGQVKGMLEFADSEHEEEILGQQVSSLTQEDPVNTAGDTTHALQSGKRKMKQCEKVHSEKVKSERNVGDGKKMSREKQGQVKGMLDFTDSEKDEEIIKQPVLSLTQEAPVNMACDTTQSLQSGKRKKKEWKKVYSKKVKSERNVEDGQKMSREKMGKLKGKLDFTDCGRKKKVMEGLALIIRKPAKESQNNVGDGQKAPPQLPERIQTYGQRRLLNFTPEFLAMIKLLFREAIQEKVIRKKKIRHVLDTNPAFREICSELKLSVENVRNRIRIMINKQ